MDRDFELSFVCGMVGLDYKNMNLNDLTIIELKNIGVQLERANKEVFKEMLSRIKYAREVQSWDDL